MAVSISIITFTFQWIGSGRGRTKPFFCVVHATVLTGNVLIRGKSRASDYIISLLLSFHCRVSRLKLERTTSEPKAGHRQFESWPIHHEIRTINGEAEYIKLIDNQHAIALSTLSVLIGESCKYVSCNPWLQDRDLHHCLPKSRLQQSGIIHMA